MINRAKATGVITALAAHSPANARITAQIVVATRRVRSPAILEPASSQPQPSIRAPRITTKISRDRLAAGHCRR
jgi:hypothetical protein